MSELQVGDRVRLWAGLRLFAPYPEEGTVTQYLPAYPGGPSYEVTFDEGSEIPCVCAKPEWLFPAITNPSDR